MGFLKQKAERNVPEMGLNLDLSPQLMLHARLLQLSLEEKL